MRSSANHRHTSLHHTPELNRVHAVPKLVLCWYFRLIEFFWHGSKTNKKDSDSVEYKRLASWSKHACAYKGQMSNWEIPRRQLIVVWRNSFALLRNASSWRLSPLVSSGVASVPEQGGTWTFSDNESPQPSTKNGRPAQRTFTYALRACYLPTHRLWPTPQFTNSFAQITRAVQPE